MMNDFVTPPLDTFEGIQWMLHHQQFYPHEYTRRTINAALNYEDPYGRVFELPEGNYGADHITRKMLERVRVVPLREYATISPNDTTYSMIRTFLQNPTLSTMDDYLHTVAKIRIDHYSEDPKVQLGLLRTRQAFLPLLEMLYPMDTTLTIIADEFKKSVECVNGMYEQITPYEEDLHDLVKEILNFHSLISPNMKALLLTYFAGFLKKCNVMTYTNWKNHAEALLLQDSMFKTYNHENIGINDTLADVQWTPVGDEYNLLNKLHKENKLYIMNMSEDINVSQPFVLEKHVSSWSDHQDNETHCGLRDSLHRSNISRYDTNLEAASKHEAFLLAKNRGLTLYHMREKNGGYVYLASNETTHDVGVVCKDKTRNVMKLIYIVKDGGLLRRTLLNLCNPIIEFDLTDKALVGVYENEQKVEACEDRDFVSLIEGIDVDAEGNVKFALPRNATYMDMYASLHRMIVQTDSRQDTEDLKLLLATMFQLIDETEQEMRKYKDRKSKEKKYRDAEKARMFLIGDFKRYMKELTMLEPDFNFPKYYRDNGFHIKVVEVKSDAITGIKKIMQKVMM